MSAGLALGRTTLYTRWDVRLRALAAVLALAGLAGCLAVGSGVTGWLTGADQAWPTITRRPLVGGQGPLLDASGTSTAHLQLPLDVSWPTLTWSAVLVGLVLGVGWLRYVIAPLVRRTTGGNLRHRGLASAAQVRKRYGAHSVRRRWRFALPGSSRLSRMLVGTSALGLHLGRSATPKGGQLWVDLEQRVRIVAASGWGKTRRLLIPIIRQTHGPLLVSSTEPEIYAATVEARAVCRLPGRFGFRHPVRRYPVAVFDCSPGGRITAGSYGAARWNPIPGCEDYVVATRRAEALVKGVDEDGTADSTSRWFEDGASKIIAAWLHAAALTPELEIEDLSRWLSSSEYEEPAQILDARAVDRSALTGMLKYLDPRGGRTTANLETSVARALYSLTSTEGSAICGRRGDAGQLDLDELIRQQGTVYLLGEPDRMRVARPLLSMIAAEVLVAAEHVARTSAGMSPPFYAVLDELRSGVRVATLPDIASEKRKFRIGYVYGVTNGGDEEALYGPADAERLKAAAGTSIYGGLDLLSADEITDRAGHTGVVTASRGGIAGTRQESVSQFEVLTTADMQKLDVGQSVIVGRGLPPFLGFTPALHERRRMRRAVKRESAELALRSVPVPL